MPATIPCVECMSLVGASRNRPPHPELFPEKTERNPPDLFKCRICNSRWTLGQLGWSKFIG